MNSSTLTYIVGIIILAVLSILIYTLIPKEGKSEGGQLFCGTIDEVSASLNTNAQNGKRLFRNNCTMCHAKDMKTTATGPALEGSFNKWNRDTILFTKYINNSDDFKNEKRLASIRNELDFSGISHKNHLTTQEVKDLIEYIQYNN